MEQVEILHVDQKQAEVLNKARMDKIQAINRQLINENCDD
jgi:hypothetical protein